MQKNEIAVERGARLKKEIKKRGYTQTEFAKQLGISLSGLTYLISGRSPINEIMAYAIEYKFKIGSNYILHGTGKKKPKSEIINRLDQIYESLWSFRSDLNRWIANRDKEMCDQQTSNQAKLF